MHSSFSQLLLASTNKGKAAEIRQALEGTDIRLLSEFSDANETESGATFIENAVIKARYGCLVSRLPSLADDSGLIVAALRNEPGIRSARYAHPAATDAENRHKLLASLSGKKGEERAALFYCAMALLEHPSQPNPFIALGSWQGHIAEEERGENGFGYDPLFIPRGETRTAAQLSSAEKNRISHPRHSLSAAEGICCRRFKP